MSCLYDSLSRFINRDSHQIRQMICDYLENNGQLIDGLDTKFILELDGSMDNYIRNMRQNHTWGGGNELKAFCNMFNVRVIIHNHSNYQRTLIDFLPISNRYIYTIQLLWTGNHFEAIIP